MKKAAPAKESGLKVMQAHFTQNLARMLAPALRPNVPVCIFSLSRSIPWPGLATRSIPGAQAPTIRQQALFLCPQFRVMAAVRGRPKGLPGSWNPGSPTCAQLPPMIVWRRSAAAPQFQEHDL
ncbi:hypothetical protein D3C78_382240 [compost metagenome]